MAGAVIRLLKKDPRREGAQGPAGHGVLRADAAVEGRRRLRVEDVGRRLADRPLGDIAYEFRPRRQGAALGGPRHQHEPVVVVLP